MAELTISELRDKLRGPQEYRGQCPGCLGYGARSLRFVNSSRALETPRCPECIERIIEDQRGRAKAAEAAP